VPDYHVKMAICNSPESRNHLGSTQRGLFRRHVPEDIAHMQPIFSHGWASPANHPVVRTSWAFGPCSSPTSLSLLLDDLSALRSIPTYIVV